MCGIAGIINFDKPDEDLKGLLSKMLGMIRHRGPDSFGIYTGTAAGLGSARLRIIDLETGDQPIHNEDETVWVVLNGEIFNYPELRKDLEQQGHQFYTKTDTEVLVHLYEEHGSNFLNLLNGQFAFAIWDNTRKILLLGRDRIGIHPLFYYLDKGRLVFGSEIKSVFADEKIPRRLNPDTISDIFICWTPVCPNSAFEGIFQVPPAHYGIFSKKGLKIQRYWELPFNKEAALETDLFELHEELKALLYDSARIRLRADVPVGAYLSGGLDSTYITSLVKNNFNNLLHTFSVSFSDGRFDEAPFQKTAVKALKTEHQSIYCNEEDIAKIFEQVIWHAEVPLLRTGPAPLFQLSELVRQNDFKVVLTGEGADEFFAGYNIFKEDRIRRFWARNPDSNMRPRLLEKLYPYIFSQNQGKAGSFLKQFFKRNISNIDSPVYSHILRWENTSNLRGFFSDNLREQTPGLKEFVDRYISSLPAGYMSWDPVARAQYTEISMFLSNYLLSSQGDRMMMGHSVEGRFPYLDHRVMEFACRIPVRYRLNGLTEKYILKHVAKNEIPQELVERPKQPYRAPISKCFLSRSSPDYVNELLSEKIIAERGYFSSQKVSGFLNKCRQRQGDVLSERENMAVVGTLSTQLLDYQFVRNFPFECINVPQNIKYFTQKEV